MTAYSNKTRREFIGNTVKLAVLGTVLAPIGQACNNKKARGPVTGSGDTTNHRKLSRTKKKRQKWSKESLVMNSKTKVMHLPTSKRYVYYDAIKPKNLQTLNFAAWATQPETVRFNKQQSGNIIEMLTLHDLGGKVSDTDLIIAIDNLSTAFNASYEKINITNFRLHELMVQLVALNNSIPADQKWITFNAKVKKPAQLRKRQAWMADETAFNQRIKYILDRRVDYERRLSERSRKNAFI